MAIQLNYVNDTVTIVVNANIDSIIGSELSEKFQEIIDNPTIKNSILDLKGVRQINSAGIGKILKFYKHFEINSGSFKITNASDKVLELFKEINLDKIITIE